MACLHTKDWTCLKTGLLRLYSSLQSPCPRAGSKIPAWNLDVVLRTLVRAPFEPLASASLRHVTMKTLFLVALATAKRVGELQALSATVPKQGDNMLLFYLPEFVAKTETQLRPLPREFLLLGLRSI